MKTFLPPLNAKEETECLKKMKEGSPKAKNILIERNMRLVAHVSKKYQNTEEEMEDLISIGTIGLIKAVMTFDADRGSKLATYAARCIDNELLMYLRVKRKTAKDISLYEPIGTDKEGNQISLFDVVESEEQDVVEKIELRKNVEKIYEILPIVLNQREREIIIWRYGLYNCKVQTQREIAKKIGISRSYVSRIEKHALEKLKKNLCEA